MRRLATLNLAQRIVLVVALAAGLRVTWAYFASQSAADDGGWFNYLPGTADRNTVESYLGSGSAAPALLAIVFIAVWAGASIWLLGLPRSDPTTPAN